MEKKPNNIGNLRGRFTEETGKLAGIDEGMYIQWLENQIVDPEFRNPNVIDKTKWRYYTADEIHAEYKDLSIEQQKEVWIDAIDYMEQHNGRSKFKCMAMAMGYENYEGEDDTYFKRGQMPEN